MVQAEKYPQRGPEMIEIRQEVSGGRSSSTLKELPTSKEYE